MKLAPAAAQLLAERVEGNLFAADQEIKRLALTASGREVDAAEVLESVANNSRFDVFGLADAVLAGDAIRAFRILSGLRAEGVAPVLVSWALSRDIALLARLDFAVRHGDAIDGALNRNGVWRRRQPLVKQAVRRLGPRRSAAAHRRVPRGSMPRSRALSPASRGPALTDLLLALLKPAAKSA